MSKEKKYTEEDMVRFAFWLKNGLNNWEYSVKSTEDHLQYWKENYP